MRSPQVKCIFLILTTIFGYTCAAVANNEIFPEKSSMKAKCESSYNLMCLKLDVISLIDRISSANAEYQLTSGITIVRDSNVNKTQNAKIVSELARAFPDSPEKRLNGFLVAKIQEFLQSFTLKMKLLNDDVASEMESSRGGGGYGGGGGDGFGKKGGYGMLGMAMMMKGMMGAMAMGGVAALAGKALITGMMALTLAGIVALKALTSKSDKKTTYEIISKPVYSHSHSYSTSHGGGHGGHSHEDHGAYGGGGYGRSFQEFELPASVKA